MNKRETKVYKGLSAVQRQHERVYKAADILKRDLERIFGEEKDFINEPANRIGHKMGLYNNEYTYEDTGWKVFKILIPDISRENGSGYQSVGIVASTAATAEGIGEAIKRAAEVKTKKEKAGATITKKTIVVLTDQMDFKEANKIRWQFNTRAYNDFMEICIYSVKSEVGIVKNVLNHLAAFFSKRRDAMNKVYVKLPAWLKKFVWVCDKRANVLLERVRHYEQVLAMNKDPQRNLRRRFFAYVTKMHKRIPHTWIPPELQYLTDGIERAREIFLATADRKGIDLYEMEAKAEMDMLCKAKVVA